MKGKFGVVALLLSSLTFAAPVSTPSTLNDTPIISGGISGGISEGSGTCGRVDLTYATSDYMLKPCEEAVIRFTNQQLVPLHIAIPQPSSPTQPVVYEVLTFIYSSESSNLNFTLYPNHTLYYNQFWYLGYLDGNYYGWYYYGEQVGAIVRQNWILSAFWLDTIAGGLDRPPFFNRLYIIYYGAGYYKHVASQTFAFGSLAIHTSVWMNTTTPWTSLGTIAADSCFIGCPMFISGQVIVRRIS
jgi:hypothetical protein